MSRNVRIDETIELFEDVVINDSDKSFVVPAQTEWDLLHVRTSLIASADVGNRRMVVQVENGSGDILARIQSGLVQAESTTLANNFGPGLADQTSAVNGDVNTALPNLVLNAGHVLRVFDIAAIAAAADDMTVRFTVRVRTR